MNKIKALPLVCSVFLTGCMSFSILKGEIFTPVDWAFVQSVGGLAIGDPYVDQNDILWIPLEVDFSGRNTISVEPTLRDSGLKCLKPGGGESSSFPTVWEIHLELTAIEETRTDIPTYCERIPLFLDSLRRAGRVPELVTFRVYYRDSIIRKHFITEFRL